VWAECRVCTSQETHYVSTTTPNRLILFGETVAVYYENHTEHINTVCGQNAEIKCVNPGGTNKTTETKRIKTLFQHLLRKYNNIVGLRDEFRTRNTQLQYSELLLWAET
jgi:hypothetical protein